MAFQRHELPIANKGQMLSWIRYCKDNMGLQIMVYTQLFRIRYSMENMYQIQYFMESIARYDIPKRGSTHAR